MSNNGHPVTLSPRHLVTPSPLYLVTFALAGLLLLLSCRVVDRVLQSDPSSVGRDEAVYLVGSQPRTLDPALTHGGPDGPLGHLFSGLVTLDTDLQVQPDLAAGWTVSDDGLVYTFFLRQHARFHDGRPVTAADVVYSWERAADPATGSDTAATYLGDIVGVQDMLNGTADHISGLRMLDDYTLEVRLTAPIVYFLAKLAYPVTFVVDRDNVSRRDWEHQPNGAGPFKLQSWRDDEIMVLARNENFYLAPAHIRHLVYRLGPGLPLAMYEDGEIDLVGVGGDTLERVLDPNDPLAPELLTGVSMCTSVIGMNNRLPPLDDVRVRQAFNYALDKELLIEAFSGGNALPAMGSLPPGMPGYSGDAGGYPFKPELARRLLAAAGYEERDADGRLVGFPVLQYTTSGYGEANDFVTAVITLWQEELGVTIEPVLIEPYTYLDELYAGNVGHFFSSGWCADYPDPQNFLDVLYHSGSRQNLGGFADPAVDEMLERARVERDVAARLALYADIEKKIVNQAPVIFVSHGMAAVLVKPYLHGYVLTPIGVPQWHRVTLARRDE
ncbi:MAG: peptide ABC transporter substrate-binding protein [Anaerolineae bacterium]